MFPSISLQFEPSTLIYLREFSKLYPNMDSALSQIAVLSASLTLPKGRVHVVSDVHGEYKKLRHIVNNASGSLRPLVQEIFNKRLSDEEQQKLLNFIYYPSESFIYHHIGSLKGEEKRASVHSLVASELEVIRVLAKERTLADIAELLPTEFLQCFRELIVSPQFDRGSAHFAALLEPFLAHGRELDLLRLTARLVRNLSISELIVAGDLGDRGPRIDKSIDFISQQPRVSIVWGNHDASWMGACLGQQACIALVTRISLRYGRTTQLEEGYGISLEPLEKLAQSVYGNDPATRFECKDSTGKAPLLLARMQKAAAVIQFKLEAQTIARNPHFGLEPRSLISLLKHNSTTITLNGKSHPLLDSSFPTIDPSDPTKLSREEASCMEALTALFTQSSILWHQMSYLARKGRMALIRDHALIFHGCVPCDAEGNFIAFMIDGVPRRGRELFDAIEVSVQRAFQNHNVRDLDLLWYLWCGPNSPLFGKDKIATFESYLLEDPSTQHEIKSPYFTLINDAWFCERILAEFGVSTEDGLIINGHVPVKIDKGESPVKRCGKAVTIDGAFSEVYGDRGYTLVLQADRITLALHHHFDSVEGSIRKGVDMVPSFQDLRRYPAPRLVRDTEQGEQIQEQIALLELLIRAYKENKIEQRYTAS
jgi:fructose-1,6-bisphosphatase-3